MVHLVCGDGAIGSDLAEGVTASATGVTALATAMARAEPLTRAGYPRYIDELLEGHTAETVRALVEAAPKDIARRFKNLHHSLSHAKKPRERERTDSGSSAP